MKRIVLAIEGMTCSSCSNGLEKYLNKQDGIKEANVNLVMNTATIEYDNHKLSVEDLNTFVKKAGFKSLGKYNPQNEQKKSKMEKYRLVLIIAVAISSFYISMSHMLNMPATFHNKDLVSHSISLLVLSIISIILGGNIIENGIKNLFHNSPNMDTLITMGVLSCFFYSLYGTIKMINTDFYYMQNLYYDSVTMVICFNEIGKFVENRNKNKTKEAIQKLVVITPKNATIIKNEKEIIVTIDEINKGDIVTCKPGEKIAVDGVIIEGETHIDESFITGESKPVKKVTGSKILAGSINYDGNIKYQAEKIGKDSTVSEIVRMVTKTINTKAPIARIADKVCGYFVPAIMIIAFISFITWIKISQNLEFAINTFVSTLLVACPCSLGLATPLAIVISTGECSKRGILVKDSEALENAHKVKNIVLDKTGTITKGKLSVSKIINYSSINDKELMQAVSSIENKSEHPISKAITNYAKEHNIKLTNVKDFKTIAGYGICATIGSDEYFIGNENFIADNEIEIIKKDDAEELSKEGNSIAYVAKNKELIALLGVKDTIRNNIVNSIEKLKNKNIRITMMTGDNEETAKYIAKEVGIENVIANVKPKDKSEKINEYKKDGVTMMCGDGINDSISLVSADIGVSISNGTDIAIDSANIVLMNDNIDKLNDLIVISSKTIKNVKQNLFWAFFYNICMIPIAVGGLACIGITLTPMLASIAMTMSSLTVVLNALRLKSLLK